MLKSEGRGEEGGGGEEGRRYLLGPETLNGLGVL